MKSERRELVEALLRQVNLWDVRKRKLGSYSGGMRQRFGIAQALIGDPRLVIVDEPTAGLDPEERNRFLNLLAEIGERVVVILSTHILPEVSQTCQRVVIINRGRVVAAMAFAVEEAVELANRREPPRDRRCRQPAPCKPPEVGSQSVTVGRGNGFPGFGEVG